MKHYGVNITTPPTTLPPRPGWNASPSGFAHQYVAIKHKIQDLCVCVCMYGCVCVCVCVCVLEGGGVGNVKQNSFL